MPASRSLIALLVGTVAFFALWLIALKPGGSSSNNGSSSAQGLGQYQSAINKAHQAVATSNASNAASGNDGTASSTSASAASSAAKTTSTASPNQPASTASTSSKTSTAAHSSRSGATVKRSHSKAVTARLSTVQHAIAHHKVVAMLFYNPLAADDQAVKQELAAVPTHRGQVVKLTIPLNEASNFTAVTQQVPVNFSPTLVLIARNHQTGEIVGFSDQLEIAQRVADALAAK